MSSCTARVRTDFAMSKHGFVVLVPGGLGRFRVLVSVSGAQALAIKYDEDLSRISRSWRPLTPETAA